MIPRIFRIPMIPMNLRILWILKNLRIRRTPKDPKDPKDPLDLRILEILGIVGILGYTERSFGDRRRTDAGGAQGEEARPSGAIGRDPGEGLPMKLATPLHHWL